MPAGSTPRPRLKHWFEYACLRVLLVVLSGMSWKGARIMGRALGNFVWSVLRVRRRVALENLARAFPEWSEERRLAVARSCYRQFGITFLELFLFLRSRPEEIARRIRFEHPEHFAEARALGRGAVLLTGHFGNWELGGAAVAGAHPTFALVREQRNRLVDRYITRARESGGMRVVSTAHGLRAVLRVLRGNALLAILGDQDAGRNGTFVPFLGRLASTPLGPVRFARLARCPIIMGFAVRGEDGTYVLEMPRMLRIRDDLPPEEAELDALRRTTACLEERIRRYPDQWFWMHRRWKTRPSGEIGFATAAAGSRGGGTE